MGWGWHHCSRGIGAWANSHSEVAVWGEGWAGWRGCAGPGDREVAAWPLWTGADLVGQEAALAGGFGGVGLGRAIMALGGVGQLGCEGGGLGRAGGVMLVSGRGEAQVGISGLLASWARCSPGRSR